MDHLLVWGAPPDNVTMVQSVCDAHLDAMGLEPRQEVALGNGRGLVVAEGNGVPCVQCVYATSDLTQR